MNRPGGVPPPDWYEGTPERKPFFSNEGWRINLAKAGVVWCGVGTVVMLVITAVRVWS